MKKLMRFAAAGLLFAFSGCSDKSKDKTHITILGENAASIQAMMTIKQDYEKSHPNVVLDFKPNSYEDAFTKSNQDFAHHTGIYDIVMQYNFQLSSFVRNDYIYNIAELIKGVPDSLLKFQNDLIPNAWKEVGYYYKDANQPQQGIRLVGFPFASNSMLLMYNKALFNDPKQQQSFENRYHQKLEVPKTWEQFYNIAAFFGQSNSNLKGVCLEGATGNWLYSEWMNFLYGQGGKIFDKQYGWQGNANTPVILESQNTIKALEYYKSLKPFNAGNFTNVDQSEQMRIMKEGKTALAIVWSDMIYPALNAPNGFDPRFGFATVPGDKSVLAGGAYFVNKDTKHAEAVRDYLIYLMQPATQVKLARIGLSSTAASAYGDAQVKQLPYAEALYNSLKRGGVILEAGPDGDMIAEKIDTYAQSYWNDKVSAGKAVSSMQKEIVEGRKKIFSALK